MSIRTDQIASTLKTAVQQVIARGLNDPRIRGLVSVTRLDMSPDLRQARIFVSVFPADHASLTLHGLQSASNHMRSAIARSVRMRTVPRLVFVLDESMKNQASVEAAIRSDVSVESVDFEDQGDGVDDGSHGRQEPRS